jgi:predicted PurR-regulated permease PerM
MIQMSNKIRYVLFGLGAILLFFLAWYFSAIVTYIAISVVLATMGRPLVRWLTKLKIGKFRLSKGISALITLITMCLLCFGFFRLFIPILVDKFNYFSKVDLESFFLTIEEPVAWITNFLYGEPISLSDKSIIELISTKLASFFKVSELSGMLGTIIGAIGSLFIALFSISFITFFFLKEEGSFIKGVLLLVPSGYEERFEKSINRISKLLNRYLIGILLEVFIVMSLDTIGLMIVGLSFSDSIVIGMLCGLFNVIPYLGPWIGSIIGVVIGVAININTDFRTELMPLIGFMLIVFVAVQLIDNILLQPLIYSSSVKAHPLEIFLVIMAAGSLAGVIGMIVAIPSYTIIRVLAAEFLSNVKLVRKITEKM